MKNEKHTLYGDALNDVCKEYYFYHRQGYTDIVIQCADGKRFDFSNKPQWAKHLEQRGIKVDPLSWAKINLLERGSIHQVSYFKTPAPPGALTAEEVSLINSVTQKPINSQRSLQNE